MSVPPAEPEDPSTSANFFAQRLSGAIAQRGLTLARIQAHLEKAGIKVSVATLSYWATGRSRPTRTSSMQVVALLEQVLEVPAGWLSRSLEAEQRLHELGSVMGQQEQLREIAEQLGLGAHLSRRVLAEFVTTIGPQGWERECATSEMTRAEGPPLDGWLWAVRPDDGRQVQVEALTGLEVQGMHRLDDGLTVVALALLHPLRKGETVLTRHVTTLGPGPRATEAGYAVTRRTDVLALEVVFECPMPRTVHRVFRSADGGPDLVTDQGVNVDHDRAHCVITSASPGTHLLAWEW